MLLVPRGAPIHEGLFSIHFEPPELLARLGTEGLTGYARFNFSRGVAIFLFEGGKLGDVACERDGKLVTDLDALTWTFEMLAAEGGNLDVYRLSRDLVNSLRPLLRGKVLHQGQSLRLIDVRSLLDRLRRECLTGCLRVYTEDRTVLLLYKEGVPLGFFHDGSPEIETSAAGYQNVAGLPGAKLDVFHAEDGVASPLDLQDVVNIGKVWEVIRRRYEAEIAERSHRVQEADRRQREVRLGEFEARLRQAVTAAMGPGGGSLFDKALARHGGREALLDGGRVASIVSDLEQAAKLLAGKSQVRKMMDALTAEVKRGLAEAPGPAAP